MNILLNDKDYGISFINIHRERKIVRDRLFLKVSNESKKVVLEMLDIIECGLTVNICTKAEKNLTLYEMKLVTEYLLDDNNAEGIMLYGNLINKDSITGEGYDQYMINIFYNWSQGIEFSWTIVKNEKIKESYIKACFIWNRGVYEIGCNFKINMYGKLVRSENDLFCYLGELFFGKRGFMGLGLDSLYDYMIDVSKNNSMSDFHLYIHEVNNIEKSVGTNYFLRFIQILKNVGINIYLDSSAAANL